MKKFYLVDMERSGKNTLYYWKPFSRGYTPNLEEAGEYSEDEAKQKVLGDHDRNTLAIEKGPYMQFLGLA